MNLIPLAFFIFVILWLLWKNHSLATALEDAIDIAERSRRHSDHLTELLDKVSDRNHELEARLGRYESRMDSMARVGRTMREQRRIKAPKLP